MDRIAVISDIHGNIPALEAVLGDIEARGISRIFCLGDLAGKGPGSAEAVDQVQSRCECVVKGNWDYSISEGNNGIISEMMQWHRDALGKERLAYLKNLPLYTEFFFSGKLVRLCHAAPNDPFFRVFPFTPNEERMKLFLPPETLGPYADIVGYGDIHSAYADKIDGRFLFNAGSVGNPLDMTLASYAILEGNFGETRLLPFSLTLCKVPYDIELAIRQAQAAHIPELREYIDELRTAVYRGLKK